MARVDCVCPCVCVRKGKQWAAAKGRETECLLKLSWYIETISSGVFDTRTASEMKMKRACVCVCGAIIHGRIKKKCDLFELMRMWFTAQQHRP